MTETQIVLYVLVVLGPMMGIFTLGNWLHHRNRKKNLLNEKLLRPPGHSSQLKIESLNDKIQDAALPAVFFPMLLMPVAAQLKLPTTFWGIGVLLILLWILMTSLRLMRLRRERAFYVQGLNGEKVVAEQLERLREHGFWIYHDFPLDFGNIDHVALGPGGVFAIETKTRRKLLKLEGKEVHRVEYKEGALHFPDGQNTTMINQAIRQSEQLSAFLSQATNQKVDVRALLVLPGWFVERKERPPIPIVNHKELIGIFEKSRMAIEPAQLKRLQFAIEQKCRDVVV